jgi:hypothetical protein
MATPRTIAFLAFGLTAGCGLEQAGTLRLDDAGADVARDAVEDRADVTVLPDAGPCADAAACEIPKGWSLVVAPTNDGTGCPAGSTETTLVAGVSEKPGACDCSCTITKDPTCDKGQVTFFYSDDTTCGGTGVKPVFPGCKSVGTFAVTAYQKAFVLAPADGTCTTSVKENKALVDLTTRRVCTTPACADDVCQNGLPDFDVCVVKSGDEACPAGWDADRQVVGSDFDLNCSACTACDVNGASTCGPASVGLYSDSACNTKVASFVVDGTCKAVTNGGQTVSYAKYLPGTLTKGCTTTGAKTASPQLKGKSTVCCK